jgi:hypothetical protein
MKKKDTSRFLSKLVKLVRDEKGQIVIMFTIMVPVIMGVIGLSLEVGRVYLLHSQLQDLADAAALAGAKKLDGTAGAMDRAKDAAQAVDNPHWWSQIGISPRLADDGFFFYSKLRTPPNHPDVEATSDTDAYYIKVRTNLGGVSPAFLIAVGAVNINQTSATAFLSDL